MSITHPPLMVCHTAPNVCTLTPFAPCNQQCNSVLEFSFQIIKWWAIIEVLLHCLIPTMHELHDTPGKVGNVGLELSTRGVADVLVSFLHRPVLTKPPSSSGKHPQSPPLTPCPSLNTLSARCPTISPTSVCRTHTHSIGSATGADKSNYNHLRRQSIDHVVFCLK